MLGHYVHSCEVRLFLLGGGDGLGDEARAVVALSNTMDVGFCLAALEDALLGGAPGVFNTDQGSQFTSEAFTGRVLAAGARMSMDGRGRYLDNIFIERLWRSLKYECV